MRRWLVLVGFISVILGSFYWLATHSYIEIKLDGAGDASSYSLLDQHSGQSKTGKSTSKTIKKLVRRGGQEILVTSGNKSFFTTVKSGGFLGSTEVTAQLRAENQRTFIGDNPDNCMYTIGDRLLSLPCGDTFDQLRVHLPATAQQPTTAQKVSSQLNGLVEGAVQTSKGTVVVVKAQGTSEQPGSHSAYLLDGNGNASNPTPLPKLDIEKEYFISSYRDGFLAWNSSKNNAVLYESFGAAGTVVTAPEKPKGKNFSLGGVVAYGTDVAFVYTDTPNVTNPSLDTSEGQQAHSDEFNQETGANKTSTSEVIMTAGGKTLHATYKAPAAGVSLCGTNRLCALNDGTLRVYDTANGKARLVYKLIGVNTVDANNGRVLLIRSDDVVVFDNVKLTGYVSYKFGDYSFCGVQNNIASYTLCVVTKDNRRSALLIDPTQADTDSIDQKILELIKEPYVSEVSAYGHILNILPFVGDPVINATTGHYEYDPGTIKTANDRINAAIDRLGINRSAYTIVNAIQ